jgi:predicted RNA binding protein YcfA (HicA-like mRNA interferase family)
MSKLPQASGQATIKALQKIGFRVAGQHGRHIKLVRIINDSKQSIIVPNHKILKKGTLRNGILKTINLSTEDFIKLLK